MVEAAQTIPKSDRFELLRLKQHLASLVSQGDNIDATLFAELLEEIIKLLTLFGTAMGIAFAGKLFTNLKFNFRCEGKGERYP